MIRDSLRARRRAIAMWLVRSGGLWSLREINGWQDTAFVRGVALRGIGGDAKMGAGFVFPSVSRPGTLRATKK